jgi:hypothetical protein
VSTRLTDLYDRYMTASKLHTAHRESCSQCQPDTPCPQSRPLWERLECLQDAYLNELRKQKH